MIMILMMMSLMIIFGDTEHYNELSFSTTIHKIAELHLKGPKKLEELAMRSVIRNGISLAEMSRELKKKSVEGMYDLEDDAPEHIDDEWKKCFEHVKRSFIKMKAGENFTSSSKTKHFGSGCTISSPFCHKYLSQLGAEAEVLVSDCNIHHHVKTSCQQ